MADRFGYGEIGLDIHHFRGCEDYDEPDGCKSNGGCGKPITNADRCGFDVYRFYTKDGKNRACEEG